VNRSGHIAKAAAALLAALAMALPATAGAYPNTGGGFVSGKTTITLDGGLRRAFEADGIRTVPIAPAKAKGRGISLSISEGGIEPRFGTGYIFLRGGIQLRSESGAVSIRRLILNTAKRRLTGVIAGHAGTIAAVDDFKARRTDLGATMKVETLRLTKKAAALLGARLKAPDVFRTGRLLGRAFVSGRWFTVPVTSGAIEFSLDEGFRQKLESLGVAIAPYEAATPLSSAPLAYSFPEVKGEIDRRLAHGGVSTTRDGLRLVQSQGTPQPREVLWGSLGINFENGYGGEGSDVVLAGSGGGSGPIGQIEFGSASRFDAKKGTIAAGPTAATLSPYVVPALNDAFAHGKGVFVAGEPLGTFSFSAGLR
jgi:hypothetical protein